MSPIRIKTCALAFVYVIIAACAGSPEARRDRFLARGKDYLQKRDYARALLEFQNAGRAKPNDAEVFYELGVAHMGTRNLRSAVASFRKALEVNPKHTRAQLWLSQLMAATSDPSVLQDAQRRLEELLQTGPANADVLNTLAVTQLKLGYPATAIETLDRALTQFSGQLNSYLILAKTKWSQNDLKGTEAALRRACNELPKSVDAHRILAEFYMSQTHLPEAEVELKLAFGLDSKTPSVLSDLGRLHLKQGRKQEAEHIFRELAAFEGHRPVYAVFLFQEGRREDAIREFEKVAKENRDDRQARTYLLAAYRALSRPGDIDRVLAKALKENSKDADALQQRAEILVERGKFGEAEADLNAAAKLNPAEPRIHYLRARLHRLSGHLSSYRQELSEVLRINPLLLSVRLELAEDLTNGKEPQAALDLLDAALSSQNSGGTFLVARNWALWTKGDLAEMRKGIDTALIRERSPEVLVQDGWWKLRSGNPGGAVKVLEEALKTEPANLLALRALERAYLSQKNASAGMQKIKEYAARVPNSAPVQTFLGQVLLTNGKTAEARTAFELAKTVSPQSIEPDLALTRVDYGERKYDEGKAKLQKILSAHPGDLTATLWLGIFEQAQGNYKTAIDHFRKVVDSNPDEAQAANNLAYLLAEHENRLDEALKYAQKAVELAPDLPAYSDTLGWVLYRKGLYTAAVKYLEKANLQPETVIWRYHLAMAYTKAGDHRHGRTTLEAALKLNPNVPEAKLAQGIVGASQ